jgi:caa(3)-type oxidase subunit IV
MDVHIPHGVSDVRDSEERFMSAEAVVAVVEHQVGTKKLFVFIWAWLLGLTAFEVFLAYLRLPSMIMLTILVGISLIKAALIVSYFMHLRFEKLGLFLIVVPAMVFCICMMLLMFFPDSVRLLNMRPH